MLMNLWLKILQTLKLKRLSSISINLCFLMRYLTSISTDSTQTNLTKHTSFLQLSTIWTVLSNMTEFTNRSTRQLLKEPSNCLYTNVILLRMFTVLQNWSIRTSNYMILFVSLDTPIKDIILAGIIDLENHSIKLSIINYL